MKIIKISTLVLLGGAILFSASCKKTFYTSVNNDPNAPASVTPATLLSTVEGTLAYTIGGDMSRFASIFTQQTNGIGNQAQAYNQYIFTGQDVDNLWGDMYTSVMLNDLTLMQSADAKGFNAYSGIARVLMAYSLQMTVDCWGKIPYSQAFKGVAQLQPTYDDDKTLYANALSLCDSAIYFLSSPEAGAVTPGGEDFIYGGNEASWIELAHAIKARLYLHQSKGNTAMATSALNEIALSFGSNADNAAYPYGLPSNANSSWYQFIQGRAGYISFASSTLATNLLANSDPRFPFMIDTTAANGGDNLATYYGAANAVTEFITYDELQFMTAEAIITKGGALSDAQTAFQNGITASMTKLGVAPADIATYIAANGTLTTANAMAKIGYEANVALFLNPEAWTTFRRTGYPALVPTKGSAVPRRLLYPQTENSYNKANTPASSLFTPKIFWDN